MPAHHRSGDLSGRKRDYEPSLSSKYSLLGDDEPEVELLKGTGKFHLTTPLIVSYVAVAFTLETAASFLMLYMLHYMTHWMSPGLAGAVNVAYQVWDAINMPLLGRWSDQTRLQKWGRRRPWMLGAVIPYALAYVALWAVPVAATPLAYAAWFAVTLLIEDFCFSAINVAYIAMINDLTPDYKERFRLNLFRYVGQASGSMFAFVLALTVFSIVPDYRARFIAVGVITAINLAIAVILCVWMTRDAPRSVPDDRAGTSSFLADVRGLMSVRAYRIILTIYVATAVALQSTTALIPYYLHDYIGLSETQVLIGVLIAELACFPVAVFLIRAADRWEKQQIYQVGALVWLSFYGFVALIPQQASPVVVYLVAGILGFGFATAFTVPMSLANDAADFVELELGQHEEGLIFALMVSAQKIGLGIVILAFTTALQAAGFQPSGDQRVGAEEGDLQMTQPRAALATIRWFLALVPSCMLVIGLVANLRNPVSKVAVARVKEQLALAAQQG